MKLDPKFKTTKLGKLAQLFEEHDGDEVCDIAFDRMLCDGYIKASKEFFFDRSHICFKQWIDNFYRTSCVNFTPGQCAQEFLDELQYWKISTKYVNPNCFRELNSALNRSNMPIYPAATIQNGVVPEKHVCSHEASISKNVNDKHPENHQQAVVENITDHRVNSDETIGKSSIAAPMLPCQLFGVGNGNIPALRPEYQSAIAALIKGVPANSGLPRRKNTMAMKIDLDEAYRGKMCGNARKAAWSVFENPGSSALAMVFSGISLTFILSTIVLFIMSSMKQFQIQDSVTNQTVSNPMIDVGDSACVIWFTIEYLLRLWAVANRWSYIKAPLSIVDLIAIAPFYIELVFTLIGVDTSGMGGVRRKLLLVRVLRLLRILRVLRVLKFARYSKGLQSIASTLQKSYRELLMLGMFMGTANLLFATVMFFLEWEEPSTQFTSIPAASWWCIITMTTVGYGDIYPTSVAGKILAGFVSVSGVILLAFPISVIVENFNNSYTSAKDGDDTVDEGGAGDVTDSSKHGGMSSFMFVPIRKRSAITRKRGYVL